LVFLWLANWWDGVDLWLGQLAFPFQFAIVIVVLAPVCLGIAWAIDRAVDLVSARLTRVPDAEPPLNRTDPAPAPVLVDVRADVPAGTPATIITTAITTALPVVSSADESEHEPTPVGGRGTETGGS
jgi:hypothetical protein